MSERKTKKRVRDGSETIPDDSETISKKIKVPEKIKVFGTSNVDYGETTCVGCFGDFENEDILRKLDCGHKFHEECIQKWLNSRPIQTQRTCPTCVEPVSIEDDVRYETDRDIYNVLERGVYLEQDVYHNPIFFGVVVCLKNANGTKNIIQKYFNVNLDLGVDSTLDDLRKAVINKLGGEQSFKINKMYFGTPATCDENPYLIKRLKLSQTDMTLIDIYKQYYEKVHRAIINIMIKQENPTYQVKDSEKYIENLYYIYEAPGNGRNKETDYFYNPHNPYVPDNYIVNQVLIDNQSRKYIVYDLEPINVRRKSTYQRIAWLVFRVEKVNGTPGGSLTRKKQHNNKQKSRKHK